MFGYVKINKPELLIKDYEMYRAVYCGLCKSLGKRYTVLSRIVLNYDFVLFALLRMSVKEDVPCTKCEGCLFNPFSKKLCVKGDEDIDFAADCLVLSTYYKMQDDINDSGFFGRLFRRIAYFPFKLIAKKAKKRAPEAAEILKVYIDEQTALEKESCGNIDIITEPTSKMLSKLLTLGVEDEAQRRIFEHIGKNLGKWVYLIDALDDVFTDLKKKSYNPVIIKYGEDLNSALENCGAIMNMAVNECVSALELLNMSKFSMILRNVLYMGLPMEQKRVFEKIKKDGKFDGSV